MSLTLAARITTVCGIFFAVRHFYDNDRRLAEAQSRALQQVVAKALKHE